VVSYVGPSYEELNDKVFESYVLMENILRIRLYEVCAAEDVTVNGDT
jgi:hypothetical protein